MMCRPRTAEQQEQDAKLTKAVQEAVAVFDALPPVEKAIARLDQRRSFVCGETGRPDALADVPEYVLLAAYREIAAENARLTAALASAERKGWIAGRDAALAVTSDGIVGANARIRALAPPAVSEGERDG